ncbi:MAG: SDR family oxidoreductase [Gemmatimonadaceae bacterium]
MKIVIIGGTGLIGSKVVRKLRDQGHEAVPASPRSGVNTITGAGLSEVVKGAAVVVDVSDSPSFEDEAVLHFFQTSTTNLLAAEATAGVKHHVALSVVGINGRTDSGYMRGKIAQENLIEASSIPYSIVRATQFFEFTKGIADAATDGDKVRLAPVLSQPMAAEDVATVVARVAVGSPLNGILEVAGPEQFRLDQVVSRYLAARDDKRKVIADPNARYFGSKLGERTLVPDNANALGETTFEDWLTHQSVAPVQSHAT